jgi:hypothetical protein
VLDFFDRYRSKADCVLVVVVALVLDCFPHQQSEHDHEDWTRTEGAGKHSPGLQLG